MSQNETPVIFDDSNGQNLRIHTLNSFMKKKFGCKIVKLSIDGHFTCPNRDGTKGTGGCAFCSASGSGDMASGSGNIDNDINSQINLISKKWPDARYLAYFQSHTNTYAPADILRKKYYSSLNNPKIAGIAISTRPDCISDEVHQLLSEINQRHFMWVELGLQTIHSNTAEAMNLCYTTSDYEASVEKLLSNNISVVTHLIAGLPGETTEMMMESIDYVCRQPIFGLKLHMFNLVKGSSMEHTHPNYVSFLSVDDYTDFIVSAVEKIPPEIVIHRISGDAPRKTLISPDWSYKKHTILNEIHRKMRERNTWQGRLTP